MVILGCFALSTCLLINDGASRSFVQVLRSSWNTLVWSLVSLSFLLWFRVIFLAACREWFGWGWHWEQKNWRAHCHNPGQEFVLIWRAAEPLGRMGWKASAHQARGLSQEAGGQCVGSQFFLLPTKFPGERLGNRDLLLIFKSLNRFKRNKVRLRDSLEGGKKKLCVSTQHVPGTAPCPTNIISICFENERLKSLN